MLPEALIQSPQYLSYPQANCTAERSVGLMKALSARCLTTSGLPQEFWSYAVKYAAQSLLYSSLQRQQRSPPLGSQVIAQVLGHKKVRYPEQRALSGRLLYWDHLQDQLSYLLCQPEDGDESQEGVVQRAGLPVVSPPETPDPKPIFGTPLKNKAPDQPMDLDEDEIVVQEEKPEDRDEDEPNELDELEGTPFTYFHFSSKESTQAMNAEDEEDADVILMEEASPPINTKKDLEEDALWPVETRQEIHMGGSPPPIWTPVC